MVFLSRFCHRHLSEKYMHSSLILFLGTFVSNVASYFYQFAMSRMMTPKDFGALNALFSVFHILTGFVTVAGLVIVKYVSDFQARKEFGELRLFALSSFKNLGGIGVGFAIFVYLMKDWFGKFLNLESSEPVVILAAMVFLGFICPIGMGFLQGLQLFIRLAVAFAAFGVTRLVLGAVFVNLGFGVAGALFSNILALLITVFFVFKPLAKIFGYQQHSGIKKHTKDITIFAVPVTLVYLGCSSFLYLDLILVKHFFPPNMAGQYTAAVILGRSLYYFPMALSATMYSMAAEAQSLNRNPGGLLRNCFILTAVLCGSGLALFFMFPQYLCHFLYGSSYPDSSRILPYYGLAMLAFTLSSVLFQFNLALKKYKFIFVLLFFLVLQLILILAFRSSFAHILWVINICHWLLLISTAAITLADSKKNQVMGEPLPEIPVLME